MKLTILDWAVVIGYLLVTLVMGLYFRRRSGKNVAEYFLSGRSVSWWLAGTSMVATTFAADTPLAVTGMVARRSQFIKMPRKNNSSISGTNVMAAIERIHARSAVLKNVSMGISFGMGTNLARLCSPIANATPSPR